MSEFLIYITYLVAFGGAAVACFGAAWRARTISSPPETRQALVSFFVGSAVWGMAYIGFLLADAAIWKHVFYQLSLIVGFATVWAWLWFASAYSGRNLHRWAGIRRFALVVFVLVTGLKLTNPLHSLYYGLVASGGPFGLVVTHGTLYWVVMALSYALAACGYLMIYEVFLKTGARTAPLVILTGLTAAPAALNIVGHVDSSLLDVTHEPIGVAIFAVGLLIFCETQFNVIQLTGSVEDPNLTLGSDGRLLGLGGGITDAVPCLGKEALGTPLADTLPGLAEAIEAEKKTWISEVCEETRHYQIVQVNRLSGSGARTVVLSDITDRHRQARRLKKAKDKAEMAKVEAQEASRMKSAMLANMSHEIRTPLTSIIGFAETIGEEVDGDGQVGRFAGLIAGSGRRLLKTLDAVLNLSKLESGKMDLDTEPIDVGTVARRIGEEFGQKARKKGLDLHMEAQEVVARADEGGIEIVLQNLLENAIKYTEEGAVRLRTYRSGDQAILEVEDTGIGMDPEVVESLFQPFRQESEGLSRRYEGTGVGLAVTKKATERMGGDIEVETGKAEGSRFVVRLRAGRPDVQKRKALPSGEPDPAEGPDPPEGPTARPASPDRNAANKSTTEKSGRRDHEARRT
jgi:signal transduction histidine kinase